MKNNKIPLAASVIQVAAIYWKFPHFDQLMLVHVIALDAVFFVLTVRGGAPPPGGNLGKIIRAIALTCPTLATIESFFL